MTRLVWWAAAWALCAPASAAAQGALHLLVVTGLSGEPSFATSFATTAGTLVDVARTRWGMPANRVQWLAESCEGTPPSVTGVATREGIRGALDTIAARSDSGDVVLVILMGHGSGEGSGTRLSVPGPDPTAQDYRRMLGALLGRTVVVINAASGSGDMLGELAMPGRVVITATRSATERNATIFASLFVQGIATDAADGNKDGRLTVLEAYDHARRAVEAAYEREGRLLTEHAQLDDDGDGTGTADPTSPTATDGRVAARIALVAAAVPADPRVVTLLTERRALEAAVEALRTRRDAMATEAYLDELERLLVAIAERTRAIKAIESGAGGAP